MGHLHCFWYTKATKIEPDMWSNLIRDERHFIHFFHEQINILQWIGSVLIAAGTCLFGYYEGSKAVSED
ncbi:hypothetical protein [Legionella sp. 227]|uniref:hypothetical protein n=1 Tax=Legionella sp. 227 TaxID=3367288 RepID=UPI00370D875E